MVKTSVSLLRGADTIGGSCIKINHGSDSIVLDYGMPLMASGGDALTPGLTKSPSLENGILLDVMGNEKEHINKPLAFIISHAHPDHYGLVDHLPIDMPIYISDSAHSLMEIGNVFYSDEMKINRLPSFIIYQPGKSFEIGPFTVKAYLMDHSAFGACSIHIEVGGKTIFYTGDFRGHGRKAKVNEYVKSRVKEPDVLLMEGTTLDEGHPNTFATEKAVEDAFLEVMKQDSDPIFVAGSGSNIDRIVSLYNACKRSGRILVLDLYQMYMLDTLKKHAPGLPPHADDHIRIFFPRNQIESAKKAFGNDDFFRFSKRHINIDKLDFDNTRYVFRFSNYSIKRFIEAFHEKEFKAHLIYSMWQGYMEKQSSFAELELLTDSKWQYIHTSGHAYLSHLKSFACEINAKTLIPVHTLKADSFSEHFKNVVILKNGETFGLPNK